MGSHKSVLLEEALHYLDPRPGSLVVDATLGLGGHAARILEKMGPKGRLIGFDRDPEALVNAKKNLARFGEQVMLINDRFSQIPERLKELGVASVQGALLDLGVSSMQLDRPDRGFSFKEDGPLDMRMNPGDSLTAKELINKASKEELRNILWNFGEERLARRIVDRVDQVRQRRTIETTAELAAIIWQSVPVKYRYGRIHPATRTFQALRIAVNSEMQELKDFLEKAPDFLDFGARLVVISFHSLEDRMVKNAFRKFKADQTGEILTKKPVTPAEEEIGVNPRSRSAKLRAFQKHREGVVVV